MTADEELLYRWLLSRPGARRSDLEAAMGFGASRFRAGLDSLERKGVVSRRGGKPARFQAAPPDVVIDLLAAARQEQITRARLEVPALMGLIQRRSSDLDVTEIVEVLTSRDAVIERWMHLQRAAQESVEAFTRTPVAERPQTISRTRPTYGPGVVGRALYDEEVLRVPGTFEHLLHMSTFGEHARVVPRLPMKLALVDRSVAIVPTESRSGPADEAGLIVHESGLLDALIALFDVFWRRGSPVVIDGTEPSGVVSEDAVLSLLAAGLKDEAIARQLGLSTVTVRRRIAAVIDKLEVSGRFQAGLELGRRGWPQHPWSVARADGERPPPGR